jgi:hypothetical protein
MSLRDKLSLNNVSNLWTLLGPGGMLTLLASTAATYFEPIYKMGWGGVFFVGIGTAILFMLAASLFLIAWRHFRPFGAKNVISQGYEFFPDRGDLVQKHKNLPDRFANATSVQAIWVVGQRHYHGQEKLDVIKRLLLPHPDGIALRYFVEKGNHDEVTDLIVRTTKRALASGTKVRWYRPFIFNSINIVDAESPKGWVHVETVLPYSRPLRRPSYTVQKSHYPETIVEMRRIFDQMWDSADEPPLS